MLIDGNPALLVEFDAERFEAEPSVPAAADGHQDAIAFDGSHAHSTMHGPVARARPKSPAER